MSAQFVDKVPEAFKSGSTLGRIRETAFFIGIVKANQDPQRMGRLAVCIVELGGNPSDSNTWIPVSYAAPFAGASNVDNNSASSTTQTGTQTSYGWWAVPPDLNNEVVVCFANGDPNKGFWVKCLYQHLANHMVPGIPLNRSTNDQVNAQNLPPVTEYNKKDQKNSSGTYWDPPRPIFEPLYNGLRSQGLFTDPERGPATTGARRETPSKVFGLLTPRGNTFHVDDDEDNEFIRLRTRSGVQILIHETTGYIYMTSKLGNSWFEISDEGIDMYSKKTISMRAEETINLHADMAINRHAGGGGGSGSGSSVGGGSSGGGSSKVKVTLGENSNPGSSGGQGGQGGSAAGGGIHGRASANAGVGAHTLKSNKSTAHSTDKDHKEDADDHKVTADDHKREGKEMPDNKLGPIKPGDHRNKRHGLSAKANKMLETIESKLGHRVFVTSGNDGTHSAGSDHNWNNDQPSNAVDIRVRDLSSSEIQAINNAANSTPGAWVNPRENGFNSNHIHISYRGG